MKIQHVLSKISAGALVLTLTFTSINIPVAYAQESDSGSSETVEIQTETQFNNETETNKNDSEDVNDSNDNVITEENTNVPDVVTSNPNELETPTINDHTDIDEIISDKDMSLTQEPTRLIVTSMGALNDYHSASKIDHYDDIYILSYTTQELANKAYDAFITDGYTVDKDTSIEAINEDEIPEEKVQKEITDTEIKNTIEDNSSDEISTYSISEEKVEDHQTIVAVIDTGISDIENEDVFKDRVIEGTSTISDSYVDDNGHGTAMAKIIAEDTADENVMLLPIKALDKDGKGTVLSVALAIKYAKEHGADVINLSLSGVGQSNILTNAINDCYNNGITVVTAAGNDNADAMEYIPGNVDAAINIAAAEEDTDGKIVPASYTNHGDNIDFAALGTYKLVVEKEKTTLETELRGTSIASAHVAAYVALLKQINSTVDGVVSPISESDVMESLIASADDFDGTVNHTYFGSGYLSKDKLVFKSSETEDPDKETDKEVEDGDKETVLGMSASYRELGLDAKDLKYMVRGNDGYYYWMVINPSLSGWWEIRFRYNGSYVYDEQIVQNVTSWEPWGDYFGSYVFYANLDGWSGHDIYSMIAVVSYLNAINYGSGGHINVRLDAGQLNVWTGAVPSVNLYLKGNGNTKLYNLVGNSSWANNNGGGGEAMIFMHNGTQSLRTRGMIFDGGDRYSIAFSTASNAVYVADGCSYYSYQDEFLHGYTCSVISNHHSNSGTRQYGETYVNIDSGYFHDSLYGVISNNRVDVYNTRFVNCVTAVSIGGTGGPSGGYCEGGINGLWNPWGSRGTISNCSISSNTGSVRGINNYGINVGGNYLNGGTSIVIADTNISGGNRGVHIDPHDGRNVSVRGGSVSMVSNEGIWIASNSTVNISNSNIYSNKYGIDNRGTLNFKSGNVYNNNSTYPTNTQWAQGCGIINNGGTCNISGGTIRDNGWGNVWNNSGNMNISGGTISNKAGQDQTSSYGVWNNATCKITGGDFYGYTAKNSNNTASAIRNCSSMTIDGENVKIHDSYFGIDNSGGTTNLKQGKIYSNTDGIYVNTNTTVNMDNGSIKSNTQYGVNNHGTFTMNNGSVYSNEKDGIYNNGTATINDGTIKSNKEDGIVNYGTLTINNGSIKSNKRYGINNKSTMTYSGGSTGDNTNYDVYQNGTYKMSGSASAYTNGVYLTSGKTIDIIGKLTCEDGAIPVTIAIPDNTVGRLVATCSYDKSKSASDAMLKKFSLQTKTTRSVNADGKTFRSAALRSGNGTNGSIGTIILSQVQYVTFNPNISSSKIFCTIPEKGDFYWKENPVIPANKKSVASVNGVTLNSLYNIGWNTENTGNTDTGEYHVNTSSFTLNTKYDQDVTLYGVWDTDMNILFDGNGQTKGENFAINHFTRSSKLPANRPPFEKTTVIQKYDESQDKDVDKEVPNSFQGWSFRKDTMYKDSDCYKSGSSIRTDQILINEINNDKAKINKDGYVTITSYVVWDMYPVIYAPYKYFNIDEINNGALTTAELLRTATVQDKEDGSEDNTNKNDKISIEVVDFDENDMSSFTCLGDLGYCTVTYKAVDGAGNITYDTTRVYVCANDIIKGDHESDNYFYNRHINEEFYEAGLNVEDKSTSHDVGGFYEDSVWYNNSEYQKAIETAFSNLKNDTPIMTYEFDVDDMLASKEYVSTNGIGKIKKENGLENWMKQFFNNKTYHAEAYQTKESDKAKALKEYLNKETKLCVSVYGDK